MEGLDELVNLVTLNLSHNRIKKIEGISKLVELKSLDVSHNIISELEGFEEIKTCPSLTSLDLSNNQIDCAEDIVPFFSDVQNLLCLYLKGNPCVRRISTYRKRLTVGMKNLYYLDDRPIFEIERLAADAWAAGGAAAELEARQTYHQKKKAEMKAITARGRELTEEGKKRRKETMKKMLDELRDEKQEMIQKREDLKATYKSMPDDHPEKGYTLLKIRKIEDDLKSEFYKLVEDKDPSSAPSVGKAKAPNVQSKTYYEEVMAQKREEEETKKREKEYKKEQERIQKERERENQIKALEDEQYYRRENPREKAQSTIPGVKQTEKQNSAGAVATSESESDAEAYYRNNKQLIQFKWTSEYEDQLEDILIKYFFDFSHAAKEFSRLVNPDPNADKWFLIDAKSLQLRWTDIEIRKYRLHGGGNFSNSFNDRSENKNSSQSQAAAQQEDDDDEPLPPLEELEDSRLNSQNNRNGQQSQNAGGYDRNSSSEDEGDNNGRIQYYTNLDELD
ncbi:dynein assembly factor axonemal [Stylonychia lemnae]|uniref:Dynein assembly factor axonemal n=1 Tax=Stylonychia lemnae TaxID=5949 RepID=A0A078ABU3_STYLE|nr:dynein assembly factor axonemal [Stylonychia lemnae]|eukprot:CDW79659.1 dynein assembly factor axonemal [Stylonychia lemnae]